MKAATSVDRFDERRRFTSVGEQMGRVRLDSDANELAAIWRTEHLRRSADLAEGSPDDGFRPALTHLIDPLTSLDGWTVEGLAAGDERVVRTVFELDRRDRDTLPRVVHVRGVTRVTRTLTHPLDLLSLPVPLADADVTYRAAALVLTVRYVRDVTDDEVVAPRVLLVDGAGAEHLIPLDLAADAPDTGPDGPPWREHRVDALAVLPRTPRPGGGEEALLTGWGLVGLPPRADVYVDALLADPGLPETDLVLRGGDGTLGGAGRLYTAGRRSFLERDWRYSLQPDLPDPAPITRPAEQALPDGTPVRGSHLLYTDVTEVVVHGFQDEFLREPALDGEDTTFRTRQITQVRAVLETPDPAGRPPRNPVPPPGRGGALLTTNVAAGGFPDRFPAEQADPCRDRCLTSGSAATGDGYTGSRHLNVRIEVLAVDGGRAVIGWARDNAATVVPLRLDAPAGATRLLLAPADAARFTAGDLVVVEDRQSRLDPEGVGHAPALRRLRAVDTATGELEIEPDGVMLTLDPVPLPAGGPLPREFRTVDAAAVRRWDGADWLVRDVRYALPDGLTFAFSGTAPVVGEYWTFTARVVAADGASVGVVEQLTAAPVRGPVRLRTPIGRVVWTDIGREVVDLRRRFLPLQDVRDRLIELGRRHLSPGGFTVVVGDGVVTYGDIDQNLPEGVTGDEAIQTALDRLGRTGGTVYLRKGEYRLEHPVLVQGRSNVRFIGDGDATVLRVTGPGGAFYLDWCGHEGAVGVELLRLIEDPEGDAPIGAVVPAPPVGGVPPADDGGLATAEPLQPGDLLAAAPAAPAVIAQIAARLRDLPTFAGRGAASAVRTIAELRRLQRLHPGQPLEVTAPDQLAVLRALPHGVVTVADSRSVTLDRLRVESRDARADRPRPSGVLLTGTLDDVTVQDCRITAPTGIDAAPYARFLLPRALTLRPRAGLAAYALTVLRNDLTPVAGGDRTGTGIHLADGVIDGLVVRGNRVAGFAVGIGVHDQAEDGPGTPVDRTVIADNQVVGAARAGIDVAGDGVDVAQNEVRMTGDGVRPALRAGIAVTGQRARVRDNWVEVPAAAGPLLGVEAGLLVGSGHDDGEPDRLVRVARPVHDVELVGNRVEGVGPDSAVIGVLIGGPQPIAAVRITANVLTALGGAAIRAWGHLGPVIDLQVQDNRIDAVGSGPFQWTAAHRDEVAALAPGAALDGAATPREVLAGLLAPGAPDSRAALDAVLRWLEQATLRGGVVLSLVDGAAVDGNRIADVGTRNELAAPVPDATVRTAGVAVAGGSEIVIRGTVVDRVRGVVVRAPLPVPPPPLPPRPPVFDLLQRFDVTVPTGVGGLGLHGSTVAMRALLMDYAAGDRARRQQLGSRIYATLDAVTAGLNDTGESGRRLAEQLSGATDAMRDAQGTAPHTRAANLTRAVLSDAAVLTAAGDDVRRAWTLAAAFDRAILGTDADVLESATAARDAAAELTVGLEDLGLDVAGQATTVIGAAEGERDAARLTLADTLGRAAEGRARAAALAAAIPAGGPTVADTTLLDGMVRLTLDALQLPPPGQVTADVLKRVQEGSAVLARTLDVAHKDLAVRLRADVGRLAASAGERQDVARLTRTLRDVQRFAAGPASGVRVRPEDVREQGERFGAELVIVTADRILQQIAALPTQVDTDEARALRIVQHSTGQLVNLLAGAPDPVRAKAAAAARAVNEAIDDVEHRDRHRADAQQALRELADEQARLSGALATSARPVTAAGDRTDDAPVAQRLAALAVLVTEVPTIDDPQIRTDSIALLDRQLRRAVDGLDIGPDQRSSLLSRSAAALSALTRAAAEGDAVAALAGVVDDLADTAARAPGAAETDLTTRTLTAALRRAVTPRISESDRLIDVQRSVSAASGTLSPALSATVAAARTLTAARGTLVGALSGLLPLITPTPPIIARPPNQVQPADGVFAAAVGSRLTISGTTVRTVRTGAVITTGTAHPLAPVDTGEGVQLTVQQNQIVGAVLRALEITPPGVCLVDVVGNEISGCAGLAEAAGPDSGVLLIRGRGELLVDGNRLRSNGDPRWNQVQHELLLDWRGDVTVQNNLVRHTGAGSGGAGLLLITDEPPDTLVGRLAQEPALTVEPAVAPPPAVGGGLLNLPDALRAGVGDRLAGLASANSVGVGALRIAVRDERPLIGRLTLPAETFLPAGPADGDVPLAASLVQRFDDLDRVVMNRRLLELLAQRPPRLVRPFRPTRRALHIVGNDVVAAGPALLVVCDGPNLASVTVVGNEFESAGTTGSVYLRQVDSTVFASNRCESLQTVNVVVLRGRESVATVTGNTVLGAQPATPPLRPLPPVYPELSAVGDLTLSLAVGPEATLNVPLDSASMLDAIDRAGQPSFTRLATTAEATFTQFAQREAVTADPRIRQLLAAGGLSRFVGLAGGGDRLQLRPVVYRPAPVEEAARAVAGAAGGEREAAAAAGGEGEAAAEAAAGVAVVGDPTTELVNRLVSTTNMILGSADLDGAGKLFGVATTTGMTGVQARAFVQAQLTAARGDATAALSRGLSSLTGIEAPAPAEPPESANLLLESVVGLALRSGRLGTAALPTTPTPFRPRPLPLPPDPRAVSLVVLGCARAGVVNNISSAGVLVNDAGQSVENNL